MEEGKEDGWDRVEEEGLFFLFDKIGENTDDDYITDGNQDEAISPTAESGIISLEIMAFGAAV